MNNIQNVCALQYLILVIIETVYNTCLVIGVLLTRIGSRDRAKLGYLCYLNAVKYQQYFISNNKQGRIEMNQVSSLC